MTKNDFLAIRNLYDLSQWEFSAIFGISESEVSRAENGHPISKNTMDKYEEAKNYYKGLRRITGMSQSEFSKKYKIAQSIISKVENSKVKPSKQTLSKYKKASNLIVKERAKNKTEGNIYTSGFTDKELREEVNRMKSIVRKRVKRLLPYEFKDTYAKASLEKIRKESFTALLNKPTRKMSRNELLLTYSKLKYWLGRKTSTIKGLQQANLNRETASSKISGLNGVYNTAFWRAYKHLISMIPELEVKTYPSKAGQTNEAMDEIINDLNKLPPLEDDYSGDEQEEIEKIKDALIKAVSRRFNIY